MDTGTVAVFRPSSPAMAVLPSEVMVPSHSPVLEILNEEFTLGKRATTEERENGSSVEPTARNLWPNAYSRFASTYVTVPSAPMFMSPDIKSTLIMEPGSMGLGGPLPFFM